MEFREYKRGSSVKLTSEKITGEKSVIKGKLVSFGEVNGVFSVKIVGFKDNNTSDIRPYIRGIDVRGKGGVILTRTRIEEGVSKKLDIAIERLFGKINTERDVGKEQTKVAEREFGIKELPNVYKGELQSEDLDDLGVKTNIGYGDDAMYCIYITSKGYTIVQESPASLLTEEGYTNDDKSTYLKFKDDGFGMFFPTEENAIRGLRKSVHNRYHHPSVKKYSLPEEFEWV